MSNYTTELRWYCESLFPTNTGKGFNDIETVLKKVHTKVFNFDYPIFDESYRTTFEIMILRHFYTREIGFETIGLWKLKLCDKLNVIMPYYNKWYESELIEFNPLWDTDYTRKGNIKDTNKSETNGKQDSTTTDKGNSTNSSSNKGISKFADTPQGTVDDLENGTYLTNATITEDSTSGKSTAENTNNYSTTNESKREANNLNEYLETVQGNRGVFDNGTMLKHYRETFVNINNMVLKELEDLFMLLW